MNKFLFGILAMLIFGILPMGVYAQDDDPDDVSNAPDYDNPSLLWKITGDNIQTCYLFGTIHLIGEEDFFLPETIYEKITSVDKVYFELDMDDPNLQAEMLKNAIMKDTTLEKLMKPDDYKKLKEAIKKHTEMDIAQFNTLKPFTLMSLFYPSMVNGEVKSYENELLKIATENDKEINGLETVGFQMSIFDKLTLDRQVEMLMSLITNFEKNKGVFNNMVTLYTTQNIDGLYEYMIQNIEEYKDLENDLLNSRNRTWVEQMTELMQEPTFFAVGAGHLGGEEGLIKLLQEQGYKVNPVPLSND